MKRIAWFICLLWWCAPLAQAQQIQFDYLELDYGTIHAGSDGYREFPFTNVGDAPLVITHVTSSCGCLVPYGPKEPILPGERNKIGGRYDTHRIGRFVKYLTLESNDPNQRWVRLKIYGEVMPSPKQDE